MPIKPKRFCSHIGCNVLVHDAYCDTHKQIKIDKRREYDRNHRPAYHAWYNTARWKQARRSFLTYNSLCVHCLQANRYTVATIVDHIKPHKGNIELFWLVSNWQALCKRCHDIKTASVDSKVK